MQSEQQAAPVSHQRIRGVCSLQQPALQLPNTMHTLTPTPFIWRDGEFIRWEDANIHVLSHSMQFGSAAFEGIRCYDTPRGPAIFRLDAHLQRLLVSCRISRLELAYSLDDLVAGCHQLMRENRVSRAYLRPL